MKKKMNKHEILTEQKRLDILNATITLVTSESLHSITINKIKELAKVSQVTIYNLFDSKDNLINAALKEFATSAVNTTLNLLSSNLNPKERLEEYFRNSFNIALSYPKQREIIEYVFSGLDKELMDYVENLYAATYPGLKKLYNDNKDLGIVRNELSFEEFIRLCDIFTRIQPQFYQTDEEMNLLLESIVKSFS